MSNEFEKLVIEKLDNVQLQIGELRGDVNELKEEMKEVKADVSELKEEMKEVKADVSELKEEMKEVKADVSELKEEMKEVKANVSKLQEGLEEVKEDTEILKNEVFNVIKPSLKSIEGKVDVMINVNTARILENQTKNHKEMMEKIERYEIKNELEHKRLDYEICKLKARA